MTKEHQRLASRDQVVHITMAFLKGEPGWDHERAQRIIDNRTPAEQRVVEDLRKRQARHLWDSRIGDALGCGTFEQYLKGKGDSMEPIPSIPVFPREQVRLFGTGLIVLVDGRALEKLGLKAYCKLIDLAYNGDDKTFEPYDANQAGSGVRWMICQDGFRNRNRAPNACRDTFAKFEVGGDIAEGIATWLQDKGIIDGHDEDLPGSVYRGTRESVAYLGILSGRPRLSWGWDDASPQRGSLSRGEYQSSFL